VGPTLKNMPIESFEHPFYDIDIETVDPANELHLIKILSIDGRRFTYQLHGILDDAAVNYIKSVIDAVCFSDMLIECKGDEFEITESRERLKKHS
jgi:hypothetical protein